MYKLTPLFEPNFDVKPKEIIYKLNSIHSPVSVASSANNSVEVEKIENDPVKALEQKQEKLIQNLKAQSDSLKTLIEVLKKSVEGSKTKPEKPTKTQSAPEAAPIAKDGKKDKDAKKEARKAAKAEAKTKAPASTGNENSKKGKNDSVTTGWNVEDDRKTWETGLSLTVNIPTAFAQYKQEELGNVTLNITSNDDPWVKLLSEVGQKRSVSFTGKITNQVGPNAKTTIDVQKGNEFSLVFNKESIKSRQTAWKVVGAALGLFSRQSTQTLNAAHQGLWLEKANKFLAGNGDISLFEREASQFLARFDSLSSQWEITVADVVFRSLLKSASQPSNVEIWAKRIDQLISVA